MQAVVPAFRIKSYRASKAFYGALGFVEQWTHQFGPGFPVFASVAREGMEVFLTEHTGDCEFGALVHFNVQSVDTLFEEFKRGGVAVSDPPNDGISPEVRSMVVRDPDGHRLKFITVKRS